jgi:DNA ligase-1
MTFKPMLAFSKLPDFRMLKFPLYVSPKLDGIRASMQGGHLVSRSLKPINNTHVQALFTGLPEGVDGELIQGTPTDEPFRRTSSIVMSDDKPATGIRLYTFDRFQPPSYPFEARFAGLKEAVKDQQYVTVVPHTLVSSIDELEAAEQEFLSRGYEGLMIRSLSGPYKQGRSTEAEGYLMKVKRFEDAEARIDSCYEEMENQNAEFTNELGRTARSSHKAGMVGKNRLGGFHVTGVGGRYDGVQFDVASGAIDHDRRKTLWDVRENLVGDLLTYKFFPTGGDTRPRHPIFKGFRSTDDLS